jgi:photosystem II stability/assembly factor-like uncharacterized protein
VHAAPPPRVALVPNAVAFRDPAHGLLGTGFTSCRFAGFGCKLQGTISLTSDGGKTWKVVLRTPRPVVSVDYAAGAAWARYDDGENLRSLDRGRTWRPAVPPDPLAAPCPPALALHEQVVVSGDREWALCTGEGGAGNMGKAVYRLTESGWRRVAFTGFVPPGRSYGGISSYGYPLGIAMASDGFGVIWESRGTLYVTRDGGSNWTGLPKVARPEVDFGVSGAALPHGVGFVVLAHGGSESRRLLGTTDAGRSWHLVHRWR